MYLMIGSRPDIGFAVVKLAQQMANPFNNYYRVGLHLCRYLLATHRYRLVYNGLSNESLVVYSDSDIPVPHLYGDNLGLLFWSTNLVQEKRSKHIDIWYHYVRDAIEDDKIKLSQMVTYYLWWVLWYLKEFKNVKLGKWQKMLLSLRSNPQTISPYIQKSDGLCTRTDHQMLLPIVLHMVVPLYLK